MTTPAEDIRDLLVTANIGLVIGTNLFISTEPDTPDESVTLYDYPGRDPDPANNIDYPKVQARIRDAVTGYDAGAALGQAIKNALLGLSPQAVNSNRIDGVWVIGDLGFIGKDDQKRPLFSLNLQLARESATAGNRRAL